MPRRKRKNRKLEHKPTTKIGVYLPSGLKKDLKASAAIQGKSMSKLVEEAVSKKLHEGG